MVRLLTAAAMAALGLGLLACGGSGGGGAPDADVGDGAIGCRMDPRADTYVANLEKVGQGSIYTFVLEASDPGPPIRGNNDWTVKVLDASQAAVTGATIKVVPFMPDHGHGTAVVPTITPGTTDYGIAPLYLFMPGLWQVTVTATAAGNTDSAIFSFCIQG